MVLMILAGLPARIAAIACRRPWQVLAVATLITALALFFVATRFAMTTNADDLISPDVAWRANERRIDAAFPQYGDTIVVVIDGKTAELAEHAAAALTLSMQADRTHFRSVARPDGGDYFAREGLLFGSEAEVSAATARMIAGQPFLGPLASDPSLRGISTTLAFMMQGVARGDATLAQVDRPIAALADALETRQAGKTAYFSWATLFGDRKAATQAPLRRLILARPVLDFESLMPGAAASDAIREQARKLGLSDGVNIRLTGSVPLSDEEFASLADKAWLVGTAMLAAMLGVLWLATRSMRILIAIMTTTIAGLIATMAIGLAAVGRFNLISVAFIPLFVGLGIDFGIQIGVRFQAERRGGRGFADALDTAVTVLGPSLLLAAGAVCLGFLAFLPTAYVGVSELGIIAGLGMVIALLFSLTLLPALLMMLRPPAPPVAEASRFLARMDAFVIARRRLVLRWFGISMVASIALLPLVRFDFNPLHLRDPKGEAMAALGDLMRDPDRNPNSIDILAPNLAAARQLSARLGALPEVGRVLTIESFLPTAQPPKLAAIADARMLLDLTLDPIAPLPPPGDGETVAALRQAAADLDAAAAKSAGSPADHARRLARAFRTVATARPDQRSRAEAMLTLPLQTMLGQMRASLDAQPVTLADIPPEIAGDWRTKDGRFRVQVLPRNDAGGNETLSRFTRAVRAIVPDAAGVAVSTQEAAHTVAIAFVEAGALALIVVTLLLLAVLRDLREVAFTLAPVVLSGFLTLATCVLIGQPINFANIIAFPLLLGVGTAFHIYFVMAWRGGATDLLQSSLAHAIFFSALATGMAFGSLWLSSHPGTASMGKILMISLAWTLVCALIFEPALLGPARKPHDIHR